MGLGLGLGLGLGGLLHTCVAGRAAELLGVELAAVVLVHLSEEPLVVQLITAALRLHISAAAPPLGHK